MRHPMTKYWEYNDLKGLYTGLIGSDYGDNPLERTEQIEKDKSKTANKIEEAINIKPTDIGLEIGSGTGYITKLFAKKSQHIHACDISESYLSAAKDYCNELNNITYHLIEPGNLNLALTQPVDYVYSNNVFIHLNFYEIVNYLEQLKKILRPNGTFWFDFIEVERVDILSDSDFKQTAIALKVDPHNRICIQFNSSVAVYNAAEKLGYKIENIHQAERCAVHLLLRNLN